MHDLMIKEPYCSEAAGNCGSHQTPPAFMCLFFIIETHFILNLLVGIVMDQYEENDDLAKRPLRDEHFEEFREVWAKYDPAGKKTIPLEKLSKFIQEVPYPLGLKDLSGISEEERKKREKKNKARRGSTNPLGITPHVPTEFSEVSQEKAAQKLIKRLDLETYDGCVTFEDTIAAMAKRGLKDVEVDGKKVVDMEEIEQGGTAGIKAFQTLEYKEKYRKKEAMKKVPGNITNWLTDPHGVLYTVKDIEVRHETRERARARAAVVLFLLSSTSVALARCRAPLIYFPDSGLTTCVLCIARLPLLVFFCYRIAQRLASPGCSLDPICVQIEGSKGESECDQEDEKPGIAFSFARTSARTSRSGRL